MKIPLDKFKTLFPNCRHHKKYCDAINKLVKPSSKENLAMFLAQTGIESAMYTKFKESTYYSDPEWIETVFSKKARKGYTGKQLMKNPELLANVVYGGRLGNGCIESGDGAAFVGRGNLQITGRSNYQAFKDWCHKTKIWVDCNCINNPSCITQTPYRIVLVGVWYWEVNNLAEHCKDVKTATRIINGKKMMHLKERTELYEKIMEML